MNLKKFYGSTIQEARKKAQTAYGDGVVILETIQPQDNNDAAVTVLTPKGADDGSSSSSSKKSLFTYRRKDAVPQKTHKSGEKGANDKFLPVGDEPAAGERSIKKGSLSGGNKKNGKQSAPPAQEQRFERLVGGDFPDLPVSMSRRSSSIFSLNETGTDPANGSVSNTDLRWNHVQRRLSALEALLSEYLISVNIDFVTHPLFQQLLSNGVDVVTISQWINEAISAGCHPTDNIETFTLEMKTIIERSLTGNRQMEKAPHLAFIGPSGAGKTTTVMKLASKPALCGAKKIALVSVEPFRESPANAGLEQFALNRDLPFFRVTNNAQMSGTLQDLQKFDAVFYDTPALSVLPGKAFQQFWKIRQALASVQPLDIHLVVSTTLERRYLKEISSAEYPLDPDYLCLTHTDETQWWGHVLPLAKRLDAGIRFLGTGPGLPNGIKAFDAAWFTQKIMNTNQRHQ